LGIWIREDRHREGIGREAVGLVAGWASSVLGIERFTYPVAEENYPSRRIAESLGGVVAERRETPKYKSVVYQIPGQLKLTPMSEGTVDRLALFALYKLSLHEYIDQSFGWDDDFQQERFNTSYRDPEFTLITLGSVAAGYFALRNEGEAVHLSLMLMKPEFRNRGIGRKVMQTLMSRTAESNQPLTLSCFLGNQAAMSFYQKLGFRAVKKDEHFVTYQSPAPD
jgi:RimJ/RimL family protein N-acetyltransferase